MLRATVETIAEVVGGEVLLGDAGRVDQRAGHRLPRSRAGLRLRRAAGRGTDGHEFVETRFARAPGCCW